MPHYKDGTPAKVGDLVRGRGYNLKAEIEGYVLKVEPAQKACNVVVGTTLYKPDDTCQACRRKLDHVPDAWLPFTTTEYGQADAFEKVRVEGVAMETES